MARRGRLDHLVGSLVVLDARGVSAAQVPHEPIEASLFRDARVLVLFGFGFALFLIRLVVGVAARERAKLGAVGMGEGERDVALGLCGEKVVNGRARGWVLPRVEEVGDFCARPRVVHLAIRHDERPGEAVVDAARWRMAEAVVGGVFDGGSRRYEHHIRIVSGRPHHLEPVEYQNERPCVARTRSPSGSLNVMSWIGTVGRLPLSGRHAPPPSNDAHRPVSVPT